MSERKMLNHWSHEHPLSLVRVGISYGCDGCTGRFRRGERGYSCLECTSFFQLHEDCAEAPRKIRHAMHPQHTLTQQFSFPWYWRTRCSICTLKVGRRSIVYRCTGAKCTFMAHVRCAQGSDMMYAAEEDVEQQRSSSIIHHPSHPEHQLLFLKRSCSFQCDACGTTGAKGSSYTCTTPACEYWIHERCASLPQNIQREDHNHSLSLSYHVPPQYLRYDYRCEVCRKRLISKLWIYHCELCSYVVHLACTFNKTLAITREKGIMQFPINDVAVGEDLIGAFLRRQGVDAHALIPHQDDVDYEFHHHKLRFVSSSSSSSFQEQKEENSDDDDDDEEDNSCRKSELICNGCITPIFLKQTSFSSSSSSCLSTSSSSSSKDYYYMRCSMRSCKYYLHLACFHMSCQLSSLPLLHKHENENNHSLVLQSGDNRKPWNRQQCSVCYKETNGLFYSCTKCKDFKVDIKCASMPDTIYHAAHPPHRLNLLSIEDTWRRDGDTCDACNDIIWFPGVQRYACGSCDFVVHFRCAILPASTTSLRWDKHHPLLLTHDATLNHPGEFYCNECEEEMNPKHWMYHCRSCDISFHPSCFKTTSGEYRNIKFGQEYNVNAETHPHPLTYQILTTKRCCDVCGKDMHEKTGFYCAFCNFFICFDVFCNFFICFDDGCGKDMIKDGNIEAVD